jgi:hypothetical protein
MPVNFCACCFTRKGRERMGALPPELGGGPTRATLCDVCAAAQHCTQVCKLCLITGKTTPADLIVWPCARMAHVSREHPEWLQRQANAPTLVVPDVKMPRTFHYDLSSPEGARKQLEREGDADD